jgi:PAT family beta-lactamase induction signal transducer AmpG
MSDAGAQPQRNPWIWVPSLYFAEGLPYFIVISMAGVMYKNLGVSNAEITLYTGLLGLVWSFKPLWSPLAEMLGTLRGWIWVLQLATAGGLVLAALATSQTQFLGPTLAVFAALAVISASHDIAADGFYLQAQPTHQQAAFIGVRSTFYRAANITVQSGLLILVGHLATHLGKIAQAWSWLYAGLAALFALLGLWHLVVLPRPARRSSGASEPAFVGGFLKTFATFFRKPQIVVSLGFLLLYRFPEAQLLAIAKPFLLDRRGAGGLELSTEALGMAYGWGVTALVLGGLLGGWLISRWGLKRALWPLALITHIPNIVFVYLALVQPADLGLISAALAVEQFGYGLGFTAYMMYMVLVAEGDHKTAHYAICTGFMALGIGIPGMWSGWLQQQLGYVHFFGWVLLCTLPSLVMTALIGIPDNFGKKAA